MLCLCHNAPICCIPELNVELGWGFRVVGARQEDKPMTMTSDIDTTLITLKGIRRILAYLPMLERTAKFGAGPRVSMGRIIPSELNPVVTGLIQACYAEFLVQPFDYEKWSRNLGSVLEEDVFVQGLDLEGIVKLLTYHIRQERFCDGHLLQAFQSGQMTRILRRLKDVSES